MNKERITGEARTETEGGTVESRMQMQFGAEPTPGAGTEPPPPDDLAGDGLGAFTSRAAGLAAQTRERLEESAARARDRLDEKTGLITTTREHPIAAIGLAFSVGFVLAAATGRTDRNWFLERARRQLRAAIIGGVTAAIAHELRAVVGAEEGFTQLLQSYLHEEQDAEDYAEDEVEP